MVERPPTRWCQPQGGPLRMIRPEARAGWKWRSSPHQKFKAGAAGRAPRHRRGETRFDSSARPPLARPAKSGQIVRITFQSGTPMAREQVITCDAPNCGKNISEGEGRSFHLMAQGVRIPVKAGTEVVDVLAHPTLGNIDITHHDRHDVILQHHFCDFDCLQAWAERQLDERHAAQGPHVEKLVEKAQLLHDESEASRLALEKQARISAGHEAARLEGVAEKNKAAEKTA